MLYQTQHHLNFFFPFPTVTSIPLSSSSSSSSSSSAVKEMEGVDGALKNSVRKEMALKLSPQAVDEICSVNLQNGVACSDDFSVDDLLDFSDKEDVVVEQQEEPQQQEKQEQQQQQKKLTLSLCPKRDESLNFDGFGPVPASELVVPADDVANLEWLSHFVEDSFAVYSSPYPAGTLPSKPKDVGTEPEQKLFPAGPCFKTPVPAKARSKRTRTGGRVWSLGSPSLSSDSSSTSTASSSSCHSSPWIISTNPGSVSSLGPAEPFIEKPLKKKLKKKSPPERGNVRGNMTSWGQFARRCSHCGVQKTPQWRTGPLGAKTLCNACGVRYKSGRLFPEYRPACSPTFSSELHSNHHRKVLEMRRKKEEVPGWTEPGLIVTSF